MGQNSITMNHGQTPVHTDKTALHQIKLKKKKNKKKLSCEIEIQLLTVLVSWNSAVT